MPLRADNAQAARREGLRFQLFNFCGNGRVFFVIIIGFLRQAHIKIAAKLNIRATPGHIGGNGHCARHPCLRDNLRLLFVIARV